MAWRQIPYPPDRPALPGSGKGIEIGTSTLKLTLDRETGFACRLRAVGEDLFAACGPGVTFRAYETRGLYLDGRGVRPSSVSVLSPGEIHVFYDRPRAGAYELPLRLLLKYKARADGALEFSYEVEHMGGPVVVERIQFPVFSDFREFAGSDTTLLLPFIGGESRPRPASGAWSDFEYIYPNEAFSFMLLYGSEWGLYLGSEDPEFRWTVLRGRRAGDKGGEAALELLFETAPFLRAGGRAASRPFVLDFFRGSWHRGADLYRRFMETWYRPLESRPFVRRLRGLIELFFSFDENGKATEKEPDELYRYALECRERLGLDVAHLCGYHEGGFDARYPLYHRILKRIGGAEGLKKFIRRCRSDGFHTDIYTNCRITDIATDWWQETGRKWACVDKDSTFSLEYYNGRYFTVACPTSAGRAEKWLEEIRFLIGELGAEGLQVDQPHTTAREDWAFEEHGHSTPFDHWGPAFAEFFKRIVELGRSLNSDYWSWGEAASDYFSRFFDISCIYSRYPDQRVYFGETDPASKDWTYDERGYGRPELLKYLLPEPILLQCPVLVGASEEELTRRLSLIWSFAAMLYWPGHVLSYDLGSLPGNYLDYLKRLWDVRAESHDVFVEGRFTDTCGVESDAEGLVLPRFYVSREGLALAIVNGEEEEKTVSFELDPSKAASGRFSFPASSAWRWEEKVALENRASGEGLRGTVKIAPSRSVLLVFRPKR